MAKKSLIAREKKLKKLIARYAAKRAALKKAGDYLALDKLPKNSSPNRARNRCCITGRPRGYMRMFGLSTMKFRELASEGNVPGIRKASW